VKVGDAHTVSHMSHGPTYLPGRLCDLSFSAAGPPQFSWMDRPGLGWINYSYWYLNQAGA
jgi:hypothetical protein